MPRRSQVFNKDSSFMQKKFPYSGIFKPYSDVLKPYSSVFLQKKKFQVLGLGSPIVAFLSPIVTF